MAMIIRMLMGWGLLLSISTALQASELEMLFLRETRSFTAFVQHGEVYLDGAFICFVELRGTEQRGDSVELGGRESLAVAGHLVSGYQLAVGGTSASPKLTFTVKESIVRRTTQEATVPVITDSSFNTVQSGIAFHTGDTENPSSYTDAIARLVTTLGVGTESSVTMSAWHPNEVVHLQGGAKTVTGTEKSFFSPDLAPAAGGFSWKITPADSRDLIVRVSDTYRARIEYVLQSTNSGGVAIDKDQAFAVTFASSNAVTTIHQTKKSTKRIHRFLVDPKIVDQLPFPSSPTLEPVWILKPRLLGVSGSAVVEKVSVQLVHTLPSQTWKDAGVSKTLRCLSPITLNPADPSSFCVHWQATNFDESDRIEILAAKMDAPNLPISVGTYRPYEGFEDGVNGFVTLDKMKITPIADPTLGKPFTLKLIFRLVKASAAAPK